MRAHASQWRRRSARSGAEVAGALMPRERVDTVLPSALAREPLRTREGRPSLLPKHGDIGAPNSRQRGTTAAVPSTSSVSSERRCDAIPRPIEPNEWTCTLARGIARRLTHCIPGDGTGTELTEATRRVLEATGLGVRDGTCSEAGVDVMETAGTPLPDETLASIKTNKIALKGPITTPIGTGFRSVNVALRHELGLYACLRPCKSYPGVRSRYDNVDLVIVRENTQGPVRRGSSTRPAPAGGRNR